MKAVYLEHYGEPESLVVGERPTPEPAANEVRVKLHAASFNRVDLYMCSGGKGISHSLPLTLGVDGAGVIDKLGAEVTRREVGERVVVYPAHYSEFSEFSRRGDQMLCTDCKIPGEHIDGTYAEYICVPAVNAFPIGAELSFEAAATLPTAYLTAWRMVMTQAKLRPAETVLIHGVGGGVSTAALQFAKMMGAHVLVTSSSDAKLTRAAGLGADVCINYRDEDVLERVMQSTVGRGVDVVVENVGEATWPITLKSVIRGGRVVVCGATSGPHPSAELQRVFIRQLHIIGSTLGNHEEFRTLILAAERGEFSPVIDKTYDFEHAPEALTYLASGQQQGKLVLRIAG